MQPQPAETFRRDPVQAIARVGVAAARHRIDRSLSIAEHAAKAWPFDSDVQLILRAATDNTIDMTSGAALIQVALAVLPMLQPHSAAAQLFQRALAVSFSREAGAIVVPNMGLANVGFVADGARKPVVQPASTSARLDPKKIAGIAVASSELFAIDSVDTIIQQMLAESAGPALDAVVFSSQAGNAAHPPGLLAGIAPIAAAAGSKADNMIDDIVALGTAIAATSGAGGIAVITSRGDSIKLILRSYGASEDVVVPLISNAVPADTAIAVALNAVVAAMGVPTFETSTSATLTMDDAPPAWPGGPVASMFQTASVAVLMELNVSWALRSPAALAWMQGTDW